MKMRIWYEKVKGLITDIVAGTSTIIVEVFDADGLSLKVSGFDMSVLSEENQTRIALYGLNKLLTDRTSDDKDKLVKLANMHKVFTLLETGEWAKERVVGAIVCSPEVEALGRLMKPPMSIPDTQASLGQYDADTRKALLARKDVMELAKTIRDTRKASGAPTSLDSMVPQS